MEQYSEGTCRICLKTQETVFSLFRKHKGSSPYEKLVYSTNVEIAINDTGPSSICSECLIELDTTVNFLKKCINSNQILAKALNNGDVYTRKTLEKVDNDDSTVIDISQESLCSIDEDITVPKIEHNTTNSIKKCSECGSKRRCPHRPLPVPHICQYCGKMFKKKFNFNMHVKSHLGECEWPCPSCGVQQLSRWLAKTHCQPRPRRPCPFADCDKSFTTKVNLQTHIRAHKGERPFECNECGKCFTSRNTLTYHLRIHTGEKPYVCSACGKQFATNKLFAHACCGARGARGVRGSRGGARGSRSAGGGAGAWLWCAVCARRYAHRQSLNKHMRNAHAQEAANNPAIQVRTSANDATKQV